MVALGEVARFVRGVTFKPDDVLQVGSEQTVGVMRTKNVQETLDRSDVIHIPRALVHRDDQLLQPGDTLVSSANSWNLVGKCCWVPDLETVCAIGGFVTGIRVTSDHLDARYLYRWLSAPRTQALLRNTANQTTNIANLNLSRCQSLEIPLPPIDEQRRIAAILDHADALRAKRGQALAQVSGLAQSIFLAMFGAPPSWPGRWPMGTIGDLADSVQYGTSAKAGDSGKWPYARMGNITDDGRLDLSDLKWIDLPENEIPKFTVKRGDLLFNRTNSREKVGKTCVVDTDEPLAFAGYLVRVRFKPVHQPEYVNTYMASRYGRALRYGMAKAAVNQANINATEMQSIPIAIPPKELQTRFAEAVERVNAERSHHLRALAKLDGLFTSLQSRAFRGGL